MDRSIRYLKGVGEKKAEYFAKLGVGTVGDLIRLVPRRYEDIGNIVAIDELVSHRGEKVSIYGAVISPVTETKIKGGKVLTAVMVGDESGVTRIVYFNNRFIKQMLKQDRRYLFYGKVAENGPPTFTSPDFYESLPGGEGLLPIYPLSNGLNQKFLRKTVQAAFDLFDGADPLDNDILSEYKLIPYGSALEKIHFPTCHADIQNARRRLIFDELLYYSLGLRLLKGRARRPSGITADSIPTEFLSAHGYLPTGAQSRALSEIYSDLQSGYAMHRLLQGDVGSGKTLVAGQCAYCVIKSGGQAAIMAPTEVLANQHFKYFEKMFAPLGVKTALLTSSVSAANKRKIKEGILSGDIDFVVATHAVLQKDVQFNNLGLVITDEQHRFGVMQRSGFAEKGEGVHILVMSATPIPRTLALMMWGDLDLSIIDELPGGRHKVKTYLVDSSFEARLEAFVDKQTALGGRVYIVCPLIEDDEESELKSAKLKFEQYKALFGKERVGLVHGKMKAADKDRVMTDFANGKIQILVSTTVIEVGINVPEATLMIIENAERFGLSQLHQLRGRVGRGSMQSYCVLVSEKEPERLSYFIQTTDGFKIAEKDLKLRGPGNFFGRDQHGLPSMQIADMLDDMDILKSATACADAILKKDRSLSAYPLVKKSVYELFESKGEIFN